MTYKRTKTLAEITQELDAISERFDVVAQNQLNILERLEYLEDAMEALKPTAFEKRDKKP